MKFYDINPIWDTGAEYMVIYGEKSNGKTYASLNKALELFFKSGETAEIGIIRRWKEDLKNADLFFKNHIQNGLLEKYSKGKYDDIKYYHHRFYLYKEGKKAREEPLAYTFELSLTEHYSSTPFPNIQTIIFDEFVTRTQYAGGGDNEFISFQILLSNIIRHRENVRVIMCANTINRFCPYFRNMGLTKVFNQKQGTIDIYQMGKSGGQVAVEYCGVSAPKGKKSDKYFCFDNPELEMIKNGAWQIPQYPLLPMKYDKESDILYIFFCLFEGQTLQCEVIQRDNNQFVYVHRKTTPIQNEDNLVFSLDFSPLVNRYNFCYPMSRTHALLLDMYKGGKFFYQSHDIGDVFFNFYNESQAKLLGKRLTR